MVLIWHFWFRKPETVAEQSVIDQIELEAPNDLEFESEGAVVAEPTPIGTVIVYVSGGVNAPDVYQLPSDGRIKDALIAAGGLTDDAVVEKLNLADKLSDGIHIHVPRQTDSAEAENVPDTAAKAAGGLININVANVDDLQELPGVGRSFAQRIVDYRESNGPFVTIDDIKKVKGIGDSLFSKIAPLITIN
jgi:competence protein ComEA